MITDPISIALVIVMCINAALACVLLFSKQSGTLGKSYALNVITIIIWTAAIYRYRMATETDVVLWTKHLYVAATLVASTFLYFTNLFSKTMRTVWYFAIPLMICNLAMVWATYASNQIIFSTTVRVGAEHAIVFGSYFYLYVLYILFFFIVGFYNIYRQIHHVSVEQQQQLRYLLFGYSASANVAFVTNLILPWIGIYYFNWLGQVATSLMVVAIAYAIFKHKMFNVRVIAAETFIFILWAILFVRILLSSTNRDTYIDSAIFVGSVVLGVFLIRSVFTEVENRQKNEQLAKYLANANARLRELDRQKTEFVSIASHQLRAPVAAIRGYASLIEDGSYGTLPDAIKEPLSRVTESGRRLAMMIDDFLNVSRIEQGRMSYHLERLNVVSLVETVYREQLLSAEKKHIPLEYVHESGAPVWVMGDEGKLKQVVSNIVDNAIKYTQHGSVTITVRKLEEHRSVIIEIKDSGIGISRQDQEQLFHKFKRASNANEANVYGTGLGLYIAKEIIRAHNGWIHVSSPGVGKGTTFSIELPIIKEA